jgi:hypothetical protein
VGTCMEIRALGQMVAWAFGVGLIWDIDLNAWTQRARMDRSKLLI